MLPNAFAQQNISYWRKSLIPDFVRRRVCLDVLAWTRLLLLAASQKTRLAVEEAVYAFQIEQEEVHFSAFRRNLAIVDFMGSLRKLVMPGCFLVVGDFRSDMTDRPSSHPFHEKKPLHPIFLGGEDLQRYCRSLGFTCFSPAGEAK